MSEKNNQHDSRQTSGRSDTTSIASGEGGRLCQVMAKGIPAGVFRADADGTCSYVNGRWCEMAGITADRAISGGWIQAIHPDDRMKVIDAWHTSVRDRRRFFMEFRFRRPNGTTRWVIEEAVTEQDADGKITGYLAIVTDISQSKQTEEEYQRFFDLIPDLACIASADGRFLKVNPMWQEVLGYQEHELLSRPFLDFIHPDDREATMAQVKQQLAGEPTLNFTNRYRCKDGSYKWLEWKATPAVDGKLLFASARDITERKDLEEAKQEALDMLRKIASQVPGIVYQFRLHPDGRTSVPYASEAAREIYGFTPEEVREDASKVFTHAHPDDLEGFRASIEESARSLAPWQHEYRLKFDDGTERWVFGNAIPQREADGSTLWHGFLTDITERKQNEVCIRHSEERLHAYLENIADTIWLIGDNLKIIYVSSNVTRLLSILPEELIGQPSALVIHPDDMDIVGNAQHYVVAHPGEPHTVQYRVRHKDGRWIHVESTGVNMLDNPVINGVLVAMRDITERKQAEQVLAESESRFREIFNAVSDAIFIHDAETGRIMDVNRRMCEMYGVTREEALACGADDLSAGVPPYSSAEAFEKIHLARTEGPQTFDWLARTPGGRYFWVEVSLQFALIGVQQRILAVVRDISERKHTEMELRIAAIAFESQDGMIVTDAHNVILRVNHAFTEITGYTAEEAIGQTPSILKSGRHDAAFYTAMWECLRHTGTWHGEIWNRHKNGEIHAERLTITAVKGNAVEITNYVATLRDITEQKRVEEALLESEALLQATMKILPVGLWIMDAEGKIVFGNAAGQQIWAGERYVGIEQFGEYKGWWLDSGKLIEPHEWSAARAIEKGETSLNEEIEIECFDGTHKVILNSSLPLRKRDGSISGAVIVNQDITERKQAEELIRNLAFYDTLTQLPNRRLLHDRIMQVMAASKRSGRYCALIFLDLDNFKPLNDTYGHDVGDLLLVEVAHRIGKCVRGADTVARFGGDEFIAVLGELDTDKAETAAQAGIVAEKIRVALAEPYVLKLQQEGGAETTIEYRCTASIGVALFTGREASLEEILKWADMGMYQAKQGGRNRVSFYSA